MIKKFIPALMLFIILASFSFAYYEQATFTNTGLLSITDTLYNGSDNLLLKSTGSNVEIYSCATQYATCGSVIDTILVRNTRIEDLGTNSNVYGNERYITRDWNTGTLYFWDNDFNGLASKTSVEGGTECDIVRNPYTSYIYLFCSNGNVHEFNNNYNYIQQLSITSYESATFTQKHFVVINKRGSNPNYEFDFYTYDQSFNLVDTTTTSVTLASIIDPRGASSNQTNISIAGFNIGYTFNFKNSYTDDTAIIIDGFNYSDDYCIDENTYCTQTIATLDVNGELIIYCESVEFIEFCSSSCENTLTGNTYSGVCEQLGCENECNILENNYCSSATTYATCGNFDSDACLEFGTPLNCPANQFCSNTEVGAQCGSPTSTDLWNQDFLSVDFDLVTQTGVVKEEGTSPLTKNIISSTTTALTSGLFDVLFPDVKTFIVESFTKDEVNETYLISTFDDNNNIPDYYAYNCDYNEDFIIVDDLEHNSLSSNGWVGNGVINTTNKNHVVTTSSINRSISNNDENTKVLTTIKPKTTSNFKLTFYDANSVLTELSFDYDATSFNIVGEELQTSNKIFNTTSTSDDIAYIVVESSFINDVQAVNFEIIIWRNVLGELIQEKYFSLPIQTNDDTNPTKVEFSTSDELSIFEVLVSSVESYPIYEERETKSFTCNHQEAQCFNIRAYANTQGMSSYYFYDDIQTCIKSLSGVSISTPSVENDDRSLIEKILGKDFSNEQKVLFASVTLIIIFGLFSALSVADNDKTYLLVGTILTGILMFMFTLEGFIPAWVIILFGVIGAFLGASAIKSMVSR